MCTETPNLISAKESKVIYREFRSRILSTSVVHNYMWSTIIISENTKLESYRIKT
jgi:hypothetical protein